MLASRCCSAVPCHRHRLHQQPHQLQRPQHHQRLQSPVPALQQAGGLHRHACQLQTRHARAGSCVKWSCVKWSLPADQHWKLAKQIYSALAAVAGANFGLGKSQRQLSTQSLDQTCYSGWGAPSPSSARSASMSSSGAAAAAPPFFFFLPPLPAGAAAAAGTCTGAT